MKAIGIGIQRLEHDIVDLFPGIPPDPDMKPSQWMDTHTHTHTHTDTHTHTHTYAHTRT